MKYNFVAALKDCPLFAISLPRKDVCQEPFACTWMFYLLVCCQQVIFNRIARVRGNCSGELNGPGRRRNLQRGGGQSIFPPESFPRAARAVCLQEPKGD